MASAIGLHKAELIKPRGPWRRLADVELATAEYIGRFNSRVSSANPLDRSMGISAEPFKVGRAGEPTLLANRCRAACREAASATAIWLRPQSMTAGTSGVYGRYTADPRQRCVRVPVRGESGYPMRRSRRMTLGGWTARQRRYLRFPAVRWRRRTLYVTVRAMGRAAARGHVHIADSVSTARPIRSCLCRSEAILGCRQERSVKPSAQPTLVRTQHLPLKSPGQSR